MLQQYGFHLVLLIVPLRLFFDAVNSNEEARLAGFITIVSFAIYGLSEAWTLRLPAISIFMVYLVAVISHFRIVGNEK